jgi:hypothetical protein
MKTSRICLSFAAVLAVTGLFAAPVAAHADTYEIFDLGSGNFTAAVGITASGTAVLVYNVPVGAPLCAVSDICQEYETWVNGVMVNYSPTAPDLVYDNGTPCTVTVPFLPFAAPGGTCNNGYEVYSAGPGEPPYSLDTFTGPDPVADLFASGPTFIGDVDLNSSGDFIYNISHPTGGAGEFEEAIDLTTETPEPASVFLLATGLFAVAGTVRRRPFACSN